MKQAFCVCILFFYVLGYSSETPPLKSTMGILEQFKVMYEHKHLDQNLFDISDGYLQTSVSSNEEKMPLDFFCEYNNMWWFSIIDKIVVPSIGYDIDNQAGFIVLDIYYDQNHIFRGIQFVKFKDGKISYIRTYASPEFFTQNDPLVQLDRYGNEIWLTTGYDLNYSAKAAALFFESPKGQMFATNNKTRSAVKKIKKNLTVYLNSDKK